ncbi:serine/threonine-protein kinase DCLK3 [Thomomys bottae]
MPAAPTPHPPPAAPPAPPAPRHPAPPVSGQRGPPDHSLKYLSSKITERKLQGTWLPAGQGNVEKPLVGRRGSVLPVSSPQNGLHLSPAEHSPLRPRLVTVVKLGGQPLRKVTLLLNRRSVQTFEQLLADISEALGFPRWKNDRVRKLCNLKGREIRSVSDFFREGDAFIAMGKEPLTLKSIQMAIEELYPHKHRALTLTQHSRLPSPRLRSRLHSKLVKGGHQGAEPARGSEAVVGKVTTRLSGRTPAEPVLEDKARAQKRWVRGKQEPQTGGKPPRETPLEERHASGEKHLGVEIEKTSGEIVRCEKCQRERELQKDLQRERRSLGTGELELGKGHRHVLDKLVRTRSCKRSSEVNSIDGEDGWRGDSHGNGAKNPIQESRGASKHTDKKEDRDPEGQENQGTVKAKKDLVQVPPVTEAGARDQKKDTGHSCRNKQDDIWLLREQQAKPEQLSKTRGEEKEAEKEKKPGISGGKKMVLRDNPPAKVEKEPKTRPEDSKPERPNGRKPRPMGIIAADVDKFYDTGRVIGDGNFAIVKECRHRETRQAYAMKIIDKAKLKGKEDIVDSEILIVQSLSHPNIVKLHEVYETQTDIYLIMEYVQGGDLFDAIIESVKFPEPEAALMFKDLCKALVHMHDKSIVHRDLKPENLLVQRNEDKSTTLKLADFGLAKHVVRPIFTVCGTPTYVAPEILSEKGYGLEVDMWAAGVILYILLCGFPPFRSPERDQDELFSIIQLGHFEFLAPYWDNISDDAKDLVSRLLVVDPPKRYTAHQVLQHPWIETAGKNSMVTLQKDGSTSSQGHTRNQHKKGAERVL